MSLNRISLLTAAMLLSPGASALTGDREQPVYISADRVEINEQTGTSRYEGNVEFTQGSLRLEAEQVVVYQQNDELHRVVAEGRPVRFRQRPDDAEEPIRGQAGRLEYHADDAVVYLTSDAHLWQANDEFSGERIVYESDRNIVRANGGEDGKGRVRAVIHPKKEDEGR